MNLGVLTFPLSGSTPVVSPEAQQHYYYNNFDSRVITEDSDSETEEEYYKLGERVSVPATKRRNSRNQLLGYPVLSLSDFAADSNFSSSLPSEISLTSQTILRRSSTPPSFVFSEKVESCECNLLTVKWLPRTKIDTYSLKFSRLGVCLYMTSSKLIGEPSLLGNWTSGTSYTSFSFACSLLLADIDLYENNYPCRFEMEKRFSEFHTLYISLVRDFPSVSDWPVFPKKIWGSKRFSEAIVEKRAKSLNKFLEFISLHDELYNSYLVLDFLGVLHSDSCVHTSSALRALALERPAGTG